MHKLWPLSILALVACTTDTEAPITEETLAIRALSIQPNPAYNDSILACEADLAYQGSGQASVDFAWLDEEDQVLGEGAELNLQGLDLPPTTALICSATAQAQGQSPVTRELEIELQNRLPRVDTVDTSPSTATYGTEIGCEATASDPDGDPLTLSYRWSNGEIEPSFVLSPDNATIGSQLTCTVTATDPFGGSDSRVSASSVQVIDGDAPEVELSITDISVSPAEGRVGDTLTCAATATASVGEAEIAYAWSTGDAGPTVELTAARTTVGESITCTATATAEGAEPVSETASATILNSPPTLTSVSVTPPEARVGDTLTCAATAVDPDEEPLDITYAWSTGDAGPSLPLTAHNTTVGSPITCTATATDPHSASVEDSASSVVLNSPPSAPGITLLPDPPSPGVELWCSVSAPAIDPDLDPVTYRFEWLLDGAPFDLYDSYESSSRIPHTSVEADQTWTCRVIPNDGREDGEAAVASVTISDGDCEESTLRYGDESCGYLDENRVVQECRSGEWVTTGCGSVVITMESTVTAVFDRGSLPSGVVDGDRVLFTARVPSEVTPTSELLGWGECDDWHDEIEECYDQAWTFEDSDYRIAYSSGYSESDSFDRIEITDGGLYCDWEFDYCSEERDSIYFMVGSQRVLYTEDFSGTWLSGPIDLDLHAMLALAETPETFWITMHMRHSGSGGWTTYHYDYARSPNRTIVTRFPAECEPTMEQPGETPCEGGVLLQGCEAGTWIDLDACVEP